MLKQHHQKIQNLVNTSNMARNMDYSGKTSFFNKIADKERLFGVTIFTNDFASNRKSVVQDCLF